MKEKTAPRATERSCDKAIKKTLAYSAVFRYPMSFYQLGTMLITKKNFDFQTFDNSLKRLIKKRHINVFKGKYILRGIKPVSWEKRDKESKEIIENNKWALKTLELIPWIKMVAVTGSVAANNAERNADIDLFIITQKNRLWITRGFVALILSALGKYAVGTNNKEKFCCNIFIDENNLKWPKEENNIFVAHDILAMHPIISRDNMYLKFLRANNWVLNYFGQFKIDYTKAKYKTKAKGNFIGNYIDNLAMKAQLRYMKKKKTSEITKKGFLHFNTHDHTQDVLSNYKNLISNV